MRKFILLGMELDTINRYIEFDLGLTRGGGMFVKVSHPNDMAETVGLEPDDTAWFAIPFQQWNENTRECYRALQQRFGPVWSQEKFEEAARDELHKERRDPKMKRSQFGLEHRRR